MSDPVDVDLNEYYSRLESNLSDKEKIRWYCGGLSTKDLKNVLIDLAVTNEDLLLAVMDNSVSEYNSPSSLPLNKVSEINRYCFDFLKAVESDLLELYERNK